MPRILFALTLALAASITHADDTWTVGLHGLSVHGSSRFETVTPGIYARSPDGWTAGALRNSEGHASAYLGKTWERNGWALTLGGITGYERAKVLPLVVPSYRFDSGLRVAILPNPWERGGSAIHFSWEWRFTGRSRN